MVLLFLGAVSENYSPEKVSDITKLLHLGSAIFFLCSISLFTIHKLFAIRSLTQGQKMASEWKLESSSYILNASQCHTGFCHNFPRKGSSSPQSVRAKKAPYH